MAILTSHNGNFQVEAISFSPSVIAMGEETQYSISIKNISGKNITRLIMDMALRFKDKDGAARSSDEVPVFGSYPLEGSLGYWNAGSTVTFTGSFRLESSFEPDNAARVLPVYKGSEVGYGSDEDVGLLLNITADAIFDSMTNTDSFYNLRGASSEYLTVLDARYAPAIPVFAAERAANAAPDDEGESLLASIRLAASAAALPGRMKLRLSCGSTATDLSALLESALADEIATVLPGTYDKNADWSLSLFFGDEYESATAGIGVSRAFANVHLSGASTGGVCFGSFSGATEGSPLFQCYYPSVFYAGIEGVTSFSTEETATGGSWIDGSPIYRAVVPFNLSAAGSGLELAVIESIGTVIRIGGCVKWDSSGTPYYLPVTHYLAANNYHQVFFMGDRLVMNTVIPCSGHIIVDYTKSA